MKKEKEKVLSCMRPVEAVGNQCLPDVIWRDDENARK